MGRISENALPERRSRHTRMAGCWRTTSSSSWRRTPSSGCQPTQNYANTPLLDARPDQQDATSRTCRSPGRSRPACCAGTKARRSSSATSMYVHTPFPNIVYALDLNNDGAIKWKYEPVQDPNVIPVMCCDTVNRGVGLCAGGRRLSGADHPAPGRHGRRRAECRDRRRGVEGRSPAIRAARRPAPTRRWS